MPELSQYTDMSPLEVLASQTIDKAFKASAKHWGTVHKRKYRIYEEIRNFPDDPGPKTDSGARKGLAPSTKSSHAKDKLGLLWSLHNTATAIGKKAIIEGEELVELIPRKGSKLIFLDEMADYIEDLFTDDRPDIKGTAGRALWDVYAGGSVQVASWKHIIKRIRQKEMVRKPDGTQAEEYVEKQVDLGAFPVFNQYPVWDAFPTAKVTCQEDVHEWIFPTKMSIAELRDMERRGEIKNLDRVIEELRSKENEDGDEENSGSRIKTGPDGNIDTSTQIEILITYAQFPLYKFQEYIDDTGADRSKDEVECLIIKAKHAKPIMFIDRNPFACQEKPVFLSGWYFIPGELFPVTAFEIAEKLILRHEFVNNLIADSANLGTYLTEITPKDGCDEAELANPDTTGRRIHVDNDVLSEGMEPHYMKRPNPILTDLYAHRDYLYTLIQMVTTIYDYVQGMVSPKETTATEVNAVIAKLTDLFYQAALDVESSLMRPMWSWIIILMAEHSDDIQVAEEMGLVWNQMEVPPEALETGLTITGEDGRIYFNPFKQITPVLPNPDFVIKMNGSLRAAQTHANQIILTELINLGKDIPPAVIDDSGKSYAPNITKMFFDLIKISPLRDTDSYKLEIVPEQVEPEVEDVTS